MIIQLFLKGIASAVRIARTVPGFLPDVDDVETQLTLLSIGFAALALAALFKLNIRISYQKRRKK